MDGRWILECKDESCGQVEAECTWRMNMIEDPPASASWGHHWCWEDQTALWRGPDANRCLSPLTQTCFSLFGPVCKYHFVVGKISLLIQPCNVLHDESFDLSIDISGIEKLRHKAKWLKKMIHQMFSCWQCHPWCKFWQRLKVTTTKTRWLKWREEFWSSHQS